MTIDTTIDQYRATKEAMQSIIDRHMSEAFAEIGGEFGATPVAVELDIQRIQTMSEKCPSVPYAGCAVGREGSDGYCISGKDNPEQWRDIKTG